MSEQDKQDHEDGALAALVDALIARGSSAQITAHPDRDGDPQLTVDAVINVDGVEWAVDHSLISRDSRLPGAIAKIDGRLKAKLEAIALEHDCALMVSYQPQDPAADAQTYHQRILDTATQAAASGQWVPGVDGFTQAYPMEGYPAGTVLTMPFLTMTGDPFIGAQISEGIDAALEKKLTRQLKRAKDHGYPVILLLDQQPRPGAQNHTVRLAADETIASAVRPHLQRHPGVVDQVWLRPTDGAARLLISSSP